MKGKVAIVTGASKGIGAAIAIEFGANGAKVAVNYRDDAAGAQRTVDEIARAGGAAIAVKADVSDAQQARMLVERAERELGPLEVVVNNAGILVKEHFLKTDERDWDATFAVNVKGTYLVSRLAAEHMAKRKKGSIINVGSVGGIVAYENRTAYCASKGAISLLTKAMALDLGPYGIRVNAIAPAVIETEMTVKALSDPKIRSEFERYNPMGRVGQPMDCARAALFLASDDSAYISGQIIAIDGALSSRLAIPKF